ncbi:Uncharacterized protein FWK35_00030519, partial [Aphis craccivora]
SQSGEIKKINSNLEQLNKLYADKLNKIEHLIEENHTSIQLQEEQTEKQVIISTGIIDIQCILGTNNKYMIKEMSIVDTETWATQHWIFKNSSLLTRKYNLIHHQLSIDYGDIEYEELGKILNSLKFTCIYVKGEQKIALLFEFIPHMVLINIEDLGCPRFDQICNDEALPCCIFHMDYNPKHCTFYKVFALKKWFVNNS